MLRCPFARHLTLTATERLAAPLHGWCMYVWINVFEFVHECVHERMHECVKEYVYEFVCEYMYEFVCEYVYEFMC